MCGEVYLVCVCAHACGFIVLRHRTPNNNDLKVDPTSPLHPSIILGGSLSASCHYMRLVWDLSDPVGAQMANWVSCPTHTHTHILSHTVYADKYFACGTLWTGCTHKHMNNPTHPTLSTTCTPTTEPLVHYCQCEWHITSLQSLMGVCSSCLHFLYMHARHHNTI